MKQAIILVGGKGTRLGALASATPKPMLEIGGQPFINLLIAEVARHGFSDIILLCGHLAALIYDVFDGMVVKGSKVRCIVEQINMGTAGALLNAAEYLDESFLMMNGDSLFEFNLLDLLAVQPSSGWVGKVALRPLPDTGRYGVVTVDGDRIISFNEKSSSGAGLINGGVYMLRRQVLDYIHNIPCSLEKELLPQLVAEGRLFGRAYPGYFIDIGIPDDLQRAREELPPRRRPTIFFDRDVVLNNDAGYTHRVEHFQWMPGAVRAIKLCNDYGWLVILVTNQTGVVRGNYHAAAVQNLHHRMQRQLREQGAHVDSFYYCPHHSDGTGSDFAIDCNCRKPEPHMLRHALQEWPEIDVGSSWLIADKPSDVESAARVGIRGRIFEGGGLLDLVRDILEQNGADNMPRAL